MMTKTILPIDAILPDIVASLEQRRSLVVEAAPGAGKTTRVPSALLEAVAGQVVVLEPRRIAARLSARRVAAERGEGVGDSVGYQVRFEEVVGPRTRLRFVTEGVLTRRLLSDPELRGVDAVVLDEFHERHLESDLALALLKRLQMKRPALKIVVMSATLDAAPIAKYLDDCPVVRSDGRLFPLTIQHLPYSPQPLETRIKIAVEQLVREHRMGNILVFLPGAAEIRRSLRACEELGRRYDLLLLPLHGDLSAVEQDLAISPAMQRKVIFATNVAESSITVEGVMAVIDSGLARVAAYSPWTGLPTLQIGRVSRASAAQRAGRAGRTAAGQVMRLYTMEDFQARPAHDAPEIVRSDLAQLLLSLRAMNIDASQMDWLDAPLAESVKSAEDLLDRLGATGEVAKQMARYPLPPRLARIVIEAVKRGVGGDGCKAAALLGSGARSSGADLLTAMDLPQDARTQQQYEQLLRIARPPRQSVHNDEALLKTVLCGFPDRVARRRSGGQMMLSNGGSAELAGEAQYYEFMVAVDAEDRKDKPLPVIRMTARIEPEWLIELFPEQVIEKSVAEWNRAAERVDAASVLMYDELVIQESRDAAPDSDAAQVLLASKAMEAGIGRFMDEAALGELLARIGFAGLPVPDVVGTLVSLCAGLRSFAELKNAVAVAFVHLLRERSGAHRLDEVAPERIRLANGRYLKVHYEEGKPPWIASRMQDFFGMRETPRIGPARTPVVVHLLAPNHRPVQMTADLAGFWERLYPQVRREFMRRYPKHVWPERPQG